MIDNAAVDIKVTKIKNRWHSRLYVMGKVYDEMACEYSEDIGVICRIMMRWFDKMGGGNTYSSFSRHRNQRSPKGKIWYKNQLDKEKEVIK